MSGKQATSKIPQKSTAKLTLVEKNQSKQHEKVVKLMKKAAALMNEAELSKAKKKLNVALKLEPENFDCLQMMALIYQHENNPEMSFSYYEKAMLAFNPDYIHPRSYLKVLLNAGQLAADMERTEEAEAFYTAVLELDMTNTLALSKRARLYTETGQLEKAYADYKSVIFFPDREEYSPLGLRFSAHTSIMQSTHIKPDENDIEMLKKDIEQCNNDHHKVKYEFALGFGLEKLDRYDEAFEAFKRANDQKRKRISFSRKQNKQSAKRITEVFTKDNIARFQEVADEEFRPIFVLGLPRSGTTVTESLLGAHPEVNPAGELTLISDIALKMAALNDDKLYPQQFLDVSKSFIKSQVRYYKENTAQYLTNGATTFVDKMPGNFMNIGIILTLFPNARIIHLYKNPMDACISLFRQHFANGHNYCYNLGDLGAYYQSFRQIMAHYNKEFPDKIYNVSYEHFVENINEEAPKMFEFCDLEWNDEYLSFYKSKRRVKTASVQQVRKGIYTSAVERWRKYDNGDNLIILKKALAPFMGEHIREEVAEFDLRTQQELERANQLSDVKSFDIQIDGVNKPQVIAQDSNKKS
ncbi:MAG: sulfotransferase [Gammaproteobacteria bacterium]|nr:sulfotransferase [Gammaproteobacteria bacterium]NVK89034.1 sulfotransferase [Gammaproteobacteria bacterium]